MKLTGEKESSFYPITTILTVILSCSYLYLFYNQLDGRWFNPDWTTDDAVQQTYIFHEVFEPGIWDGDYITRVMRGYLAPLHYWITYVATYLSGSVVMGGHIVMAIQVGLVAVFLFQGLKALTASYAPGLFAVAWFIHTRTVVQRLTGGLPRGWAAPVFAAFFYCILTGRHKWLLFFILCGCLLNPPATFLVCAAYGIWLLILAFNKSTRSEGLRALRNYFFVAPVFAIVTLIVIHRPSDVGQMVDYETAKEMPAFGRGGRFAFIPQPSIQRHLKTYGYNAFVTRLHDPGELVQAIAPYFIFGILLISLATSAYRKKLLIPSGVWSFFIAIVLVYLTSRQVLFKLYVPNRHLLIPMTFFLIVAYCSLCWRAGKFSGWKGDLFQSTKFLLLALIIWIGSGNGLQGDANFNYHKYRKGKAFEWLEQNSEKDSLIAGHPTHIDPVFLYAQRPGYVTSEIAHPFYKKFYDEMERRLEISLRAHYSHTINEFLDLLKGEGVDYYIFSKQRFYGKSLKTERYYKPLHILIKELTAGDFNDYAYKLIPKRVDTEKFPPLVFRDQHSAVIDVKALKDYVVKHPEFGTRRFYD